MVPAVLAQLERQNVIQGSEKEQTSYSASGCGTTSSIYETRQQPQVVYSPNHSIRSLVLIDIWLASLHSGALLANGKL